MFVSYWETIFPPPLSKYWVGGAPPPRPPPCSYTPVNLLTCLLWREKDMALLWRELRTCSERWRTVVFRCIKPMR